jgi:iron complex transport system substrate-binding protein
MCGMGWECRQGPKILAKSVLNRRDFLALLTLPALMPRKAAAGMRVAVLDWALMETMLAVGATPLAVVAADDWNREGLGARLPAGVADLGLSPEINFELLASLQPELIVMSPFVAQLKPVLQRIAPVWEVSVFEAAGRPLAHQFELTRRIGDRLGRGRETDAYLAMATQRFAEYRERLGARKIGPVLLVNFVDARHVRVYGGNGLYQNVLEMLGLVNAWKGQTNYWGYATVGVEQLATKEDLHLIAFEPVPPDARPTLQRSPLWAELPFIRAGHFVTLPSVLMFGALPSALRLAELLDGYLHW